MYFSHSRIVSRRNALACRPVTTVSRLSPVRLSLGRPIILLPGGTSERAVERCGWPTEFNGFPGREVGRARAFENGVGAKIGAIGRTLPEYFTDDPVMVKPRRYPWPRYKKTRGRRSESPYFFLHFYFPNARPRRAQHDAEASHSNHGVPSFALHAKLARRVTQPRHRVSIRPEITSSAIL